MADNDIRRECILELFQSLRPVVNKRIYSIWESIYTSKEIPQRYWLEKFQLSLKTTLQIQSCDLCQNISHVQELATTLHKAYILTGEVYHEEAPQVNESIDLLLDFTKEVIVSTARQLWYAPYLVYFVTHDKSKAAAGRQEMDALIKASIKTTLKQQTSEMILAQRAVVEKYKDHVKYEPEIESEERASSSSELSDESYSDIDSSVTDKSEKLTHHSPPLTPPSSPPQSPPRSPPKYVLGDDLKLSISPLQSPKRPPSIASSASSLKALPTDGDDINNIYIPRKSNPASLDIPLMKKPKSHLYKMSWYRGNPKLYQYLIAKKKNVQRE
jgi:hypothetical protein